MLIKGFRRIGGLFRYLEDHVLVFFSLLFIISVPVLFSFEQNLYDSNVFLYFILLIFVLMILVRRIRKVLFITLLVSIIAWLRVGYDLKIEQESLDFWQEDIDNNIRIKGFIVEEPKYKDDKIDLVFEIYEKVDSDEEVKKIHILTSTERYKRPKLGSVCELNGTLEEPANFDEFDYKAYLRNRRIYYVMRRPVIDCDTNLEKGFILRNRLYSFKQVLVGRVQRLMPEPQSSLLIGVLLGDSRVFDQGFDDALRVTGTTHIIAASGYNVTILVISVNWLLGSFIKPGKRIIISLVLIWIFTSLSGMSPSIVRAAIMVSLTLIGSAVGGMKSIHILLPVSAFLFVLVDPRILFSLSFQLSVISTASLIYLSPVVSVFLKSLLSHGLFKGLLLGLEEYFVPTLCCSLGTFPMIASTFGEVSMIGLLSNLLILPVLETTMLLGFVGIGLSFISLALGNAFLLFAWVQLRYFELVVRMLGEWSFGVIQLESFKSNWFLTIGYIVLLFLIISNYPEGEDNFYFKKLELL